MERRMQTEPNGWLPSAEWCGSISLCGSEEENAPQVVRHSALVEIAPSIQIRLERPMPLCQNTILDRTGSATSCKPKPLRTFREREGARIVRGGVGRFFHNVDVARDSGVGDRLQGFQINHLPRSRRCDQAAVTEWHAACHWHHQGNTSEKGYAGPHKIERRVQPRRAKRHRKQTRPAPGVGCNEWFGFMIRAWTALGDCSQESALRNRRSNVPAKLQMSPESRALANARP